ncbi:MAG: metallophosphatase [Armatimonadetes bacterium]|nr:metallophosphatase [Armatimonadota bacterium]
MPALTILHTNDRHGCWSEATTSRIVQEKATREPALLLDAGDAVRSGNIGFGLFGEPVLSAMNRAGYDAMAIGNREFHFRPAGLKRKISGARFPVLSANLHQANGQPLPEVRPYVMFHCGGVRVAVVGLTVPMIAPGSGACRISPYRFDPPVPAARRYASALRPQADILIALTHIGIEQDRLLAQAVPELDIIIGGHSHTALSEPERIGSAFIAHAGSHERFLGCLELEVRQGGIHHIQGCLIPIAEGFPLDVPYRI